MSGISNLVAWLALAAVLVAGAASGRLRLSVDPQPDGVVVVELSWGEGAGVI